MMDLLETKPRAGITFTRRATPIHPESRPIWRVSLIALILLLLGRGNKASPQKVLALSSIVSSKHKRACLASVLSNTKSVSTLTIRFDPSVNRAIDFGIAEGIFILDKSKNIQLTDRGLEFARKIMRDDEIFSEEKQFMNGFSKNDLSEKVVEQLIAS
jgi:hypothetical protein